MRMSRLLPTACMLVALSACTPASTKFTVDEPDATSSATSAQSSTSSEVVTNNVSYIGTIEEAGISIYMQGTHRLTLADGRFVLLESSTVSLGDAVGKKAEVFGSVRPTIEAGGIIMNVERLTIMEHSSSSDISTDTSSLEATTAASASSASTAAPATTPSSAAMAQTSSAALSAAASSAMTSEASSVMENTSTMTVTPTMTEHAAAMATEDLSADRWTQQYCSSHIGFCLPIHKNWWFKSFGTTASALWHVEISDAPIDVIGSGPIVVTVRSGTVESRKAVDGQVRVEGDVVTGFRSWTENRYFEIRAPRALEGAVQYLAKNLSLYETE